MFAKKYLSCHNCNSSRNNHGARDYCVKCYPIILRLEKAKRWNYSDKTTLKNFPELSGQIDQKKFNKIKNGFIKQLETRLSWFRTRENKLKGDIGGIDLEDGFNRIAKYCGVRDNSLFHSSANTFDHNFSIEQKKIIFEFIDEIEQNRKWKGIDWYEIFDEKNNK